MKMDEMKRQLLDRLKDMDGKWRSRDIVIMRFDYRDIELAQQGLIELNQSGVIETRRTRYHLIMVTEYRYLPPLPPILKVVK
jgi:hypothetical protein